MENASSTNITRDMLHGMATDINDRLETDLHVFVSDTPFNNELYATVNGRVVPIMKGSRGAVFTALGHVESGLKLGIAMPTKPLGPLEPQERDRIRAEIERHNLVRPIKL